MSSPILIREAEPLDLEVLCSFQQSMALETEGKTLDVTRLLRGIAAILEDPARGVYRLALQDGVAVGCIMTTFEWSDWRAGWFWWVQSVFVRREARRRGIYRALYERVLADARVAGDVCGVRLYVERANLSAQATYRALGMDLAHYEMFEVDFVLGGKSSPSPASLEP